MLNIFVISKFILQAITKNIEFSNRQYLKTVIDHGCIIQKFAGAGGNQLIRN